MKTEQVIKYRVVKIMSDSDRISTGVSLLCSYEGKLKVFTYTTQYDGVVDDIKIKYDKNIAYDSLIITPVLTKGYFNKEKIDYNHTLILKI